MAYCCPSWGTIVVHCDGPTLFDFQPREKQVEIDQLQYELGAVRRRTDTEVASLRQRVADLELQVNEARKEADEYYRSSVERNTEVTALANQVTFSVMYCCFQIVFNRRSILEFLQVGLDNLCVIIGAVFTDQIHFMTPS